ncbi:hypothetical protein [Limnohabitans sp. T6-5]|uniref:hypothetical protein n=1 Tax=Limnohabitans sp. T6-5 TaxID=1100724 RepID=UPI001E412FD4|nr:hypothetical protein [Limnohabitans sp. T6-5]
MQQTIAQAEQGSIVILGIILGVIPDKPETGYGYIQGAYPPSRYVEEQPLADRSEATAQGATVQCQASGRIFDLIAEFHGA